MPLTLIPEKTENSLGIVKQDVLPYTDPNTQVPAVQYERLKDAVIANALAIGLGDGSTSGSLVERLDSLSLQDAYDGGNTIDTTGSVPVIVQTDTASLSIAGTLLEASDTLEVKSGSKAANAIDLSVGDVDAGIRMLIDSQVRLFLQRDGGGVHRLEPGSDLGTSLGSSSRRFGEVNSAVFRGTELSQPTVGSTLLVKGRHTSTVTEPAVQVANASALSASAGEQRLLEVLATGNQSGTAALVVADIVLAGTKGSGATSAIFRARLDVGSPLLNVTTAQVQVASGSAASPGLAFVDDAATGMFYAGASLLGLATAGSSRVEVDTSKVTVNLPIRAPAGGSQAPVYTFIGDPDTGLYSAAANILGLAAGGALCLAVSTTGLGSNVPVYVPNGSAGAPSYGFSSDGDTGFYWVGANQLGVAAAGVQVGYFASSGGVTSHLRMANGNITAGTAPVANALYTKNVPKAWLKAYNLTTVDDDFGVASIASDGGSPAGVTVTFDHSTAGQYQQAIVSTAPGTSATTAKWHTVDNFAVNSCRVRAWVWSGTAIVQAAVSGDWSLVRFGTVT